MGREDLEATAGSVRVDPGSMASWPYHILFRLRSVLAAGSTRTLCRFRPNKDWRAATVTVTTPFPPSLDLDMRLYHLSWRRGFSDLTASYLSVSHLGSRSELGVGERTQRHFWGIDCCIRASGGNWLGASDESTWPVWVWQWAKILLVLSQWGFYGSITNTSIF
jgi:hypothetical protein